MYICITFVCTYKFRVNTHFVTFQLAIKQTLTYHGEHKGYFVFKKLNVNKETC